jgi:hypothetical protein
MARLDRHASASRWRPHRGAVTAKADIRRGLFAAPDCGHPQTGGAWLRFEQTGLAVNGSLGTRSGTGFHKNDGITNLLDTLRDPRSTPREQSVWCGRELSDNLCASIPYAQVRENSDPLRANGHFQRRPHCRRLRIPTPPVLCVYKDCRDESSCWDARRRLLKILL